MAGKKGKKAGKKREIDLCRVLYRAAHGKAIFAVYFLVWHTAKHLCCVLSDLAHGKVIFAVFLAILHTAKVSRQNAADILLRAGKVGGRRGVCAGRAPLPCVRWGHTAKPRRYDGAVSRTPSGHVAQPLPCRRPLPCVLAEVHRVHLFAVFFFEPLPWLVICRVLFLYVAVFYIFAVFFIRGTRQIL
jgi:hypothetical protein